MTFGEACRSIRLARNLSQVQVAEAADIHQSRVSEIEPDSYSPGLDQARKLAGGLGVNLSDVIAVCEGLLTVEELVSAVNGPGGESFVAKHRRSQRPGKEMAERAQKLGYEVLRVVDAVMQAKLEPEVVKWFNHIYAAQLTTDGRPPGSPNRRALVIAGDEPAALPSAS